MSLHPIIKWAQRKDRIFVTLGLRDIINETVSIKDGKLEFKGTSNQKPYEFKVDLYEEIDEAKSQWNKTGFQMIFVLIKKQGKHQHWPRLTKENVKSQYVQIDWDKWVDEDEQNEQADKGLGNLDYDSMNNFNDSDDEEEEEQAKKQANLDDLQKQEEVNA